MGRLPTHRRVCLQPCKTLNNIQVFVRGCLWVQPSFTIRRPPSTSTRAMNMEASACADFMKTRHEGSRITIERQVQGHVKKVNLTKKPILFKPGDLVWVHLRKDHFPQECKSKILPQSNGSFVQRINENAYKIAIPLDKYSMSDTFINTDLSPFYGDEDLDPRTDLPHGEMTRRIPWTSP